MDRMISANMGNAITSISYDFAGRKNAMDDAEELGALTWAPGATPTTGSASLPNKPMQEAASPTWLMIWQAG
jgi:hypothetical protein